MASMFEIYQQHADKYNELVDAEDHQGNLTRCLLELTDWTGKSVLEAGVGTGRVTTIYAKRPARIVCLDQSGHMIDSARTRLAHYAEKLTFHQADNTHLPTLGFKCDIFVEGWSWGHSIVGSGDPVETTTETLLDGVRRNTTHNAEVIIIETLGTNVHQPEAPHRQLQEFYNVLEDRYNLRKLVVSTDYAFENPSRAANVLGFFFGEEMKEEIIGSGITVVPEFTGVWYGRMPET